jgi:5-formyltetrahydrofolate cyclo-ligase
VAEPQRPRDSGTGPDPAKVALRDQILTARNRLPVPELGAAGTAITGHLLAQPEVRRAATVAAYVSTASEPGTGILLDTLVDAGKRVILPVLLPDDDLDWAVYEGATALLPARRGILEPAGRRLGVEAIATADVVLVPGLAVSPNGVRLGRGGGSYDRALARVPAGTFTCALLHDGEVGRDVPVAPHDRAVAAAVTPSGVTRFRRGPG